jgi:hypothetical protein
MFMRWTGSSPKHRFGLNFKSAAKSAGGTDTFTYDFFFAGSSSLCSLRSKRSLSS